jgi:alkanesulfonate monooxygenase SsuD/methylene tetrahydromethanopterin reductase-like flavin-dependent oxidoreductase (luciferase family)
MDELGRVYREGKIPTELIPDDLINKVSVAGNVDDCETAIRALIDAGADEVVFFPMPAAETESLVQRIAADLLPRFR